MDLIMDYLPCVIPLLFANEFAFEQAGAMWDLRAGDKEKDF